jgi:hypothetical protein
MPECELVEWGWCIDPPDLRGCFQLNRAEDNLYYYDPFTAIAYRQDAQDGRWWRASMGGVSA